MSNSIVDPAIAGLIADVVHIGSGYDMDNMDRLYTADEIFLILTAEGEVIRRTRAVFDEFRAHPDAGEPLATEYRALQVEQQGGNAVALLDRRMSPQAPPARRALRLRRGPDRWAVAGEIVTPSPGREGEGGAFPPLRRRA
ncbi:hypothetical protein [Sphingosinicella sp. BN140058]|uniref:hypothetical protein n=1 Tax=Sphingosinicella sp. BN140058 TaxID=1892855 RepID=UPI001010BA3C|nr:hypothetical protein [Sphingosinicella sp. BN140058]QAY78953.1 hypothetical protein ETR14_22235 [Sphingosinicella sp. BN140058]